MLLKVPCHLWAKSRKQGNEFCDEEEVGEGEGGEEKGEQKVEEKEEEKKRKSISETQSLGLKSDLAGQGSPLREGRRS